KDGRGRVIDRRREGLGRDIDDEAKRESWVLLHGSLDTDGNALKQRVIGKAGAAMNAKKWVILGDEVADLRQEDDDAVVLCAELDEVFDVEGEDDAILGAVDGA